MRLPRADPFLILILLSAGLAAVLPATGGAAAGLDVATSVAVFLLFLGYGAKLPAQEALAGLRNVRLHGVILAFTYGVFPLVGVGLLLLPDSVLGPVPTLGLVWLCLVPSTVQSSITFTSIAGGNVAGAMVAATTSNLLGVGLTPLLALVILPAAGGGGIGLDQFLKVVVQLLVPFLLGQLSRRWTAGFMSRHAKRIKYLDQFVIALVVYTAFSDFFATGSWREVSLRDLAAIGLVALLILGAMLWLTNQTAKWLRFNRSDRIAIVFCGTKKSLATGVPMASVLFAGQAVGVIVLPLMVFHQAQLMACSAIAARWARSAPQEEAGGSVS